MHPFDAADLKDKREEEYERWEKDDSDARVYDEDWNGGDGDDD